MSASDNTHRAPQEYQFIESKGYRAIADPQTRGQTWSSGAVELKTAVASTRGTALTPAGYPFTLPSILGKMSLTILAWERHTPSSRTR